MPDETYSVQRPAARLLIASATALFLELACIRWAGSHVIHLAFVANLLLITAFLGLGCGTWLGPSLSARARQRWLALGLLALLAFVACVAFAGFAVTINGREVIYFGNALLERPLPAWMVLPLLGALLATSFASLGTVVGCEMKTIATSATKAAPALGAYSLDVSGSLIGVVLFSAASFLGLPAPLWFAVALFGWLFLLPARRGTVLLGALVALVTIGIVQWLEWDSVWSPYQRVQLLSQGPAPARAPGDPAAGTARYRLSVNNIVHQYVSDVRQREPFYEFPYRAAGATLPSGGAHYLTAVPPYADWKRDPFSIRTGRWNGRVAIIGAGNGTDVAAALAYGAGHIDAVELDPLLSEIGSVLQPNRPFADPRVTLHNMDGRTFLERDGPRYDVIVFALPDSLTLASPYASVRLESFLFTQESFSRALERLDPKHGLLVLYNYYRKPWLIDRIAGTLARASHQSPLVLVGPDRLLSAVFIAGPGLAHVDPRLGRGFGFRRAEARHDVGTATDDWPFLYLRERTIPNQIQLALAMLLGLTLAIVWVLRRYTLRAERAEQGGAPSLGRLAPFFCMGVAFLLLETTGLVRMALLFGSTWFVNALVFASVLVMVLIANAIAQRLPLRRGGLLFVLLLSSLAVAYGLRPSAMVAWDALPKYIVATLVLFVPILCANLVFSRAFREFPWPSSAFGANLLGAVFGGALENLALITGHNALLLVAAALYSGAWLSVSLARSSRLLGGPTPGPAAHSQHAPP